MAARGRPRTFDRDEALCRAHDLFWASGYEGVTLTDLQQAMGGITPPSFYAAFGSKEALFREVVDLHRRTYGAGPMTALTARKSTREAMEGMLVAAAETYSQPGKPRGCMLLGAVNCSAPNISVQDNLREMRQQRHKIIRKRLERGVAEGDVPPGTDLTALTFYFITVVDGLALQARDGATRKLLVATARNAMAVWDEMTRHTGGR